MRFYSIETAGQKHIFIGAEQDRSAPVPAFPGACVMRIAPSPDCDFRLEAVSGEPYPPDVLRIINVDSTHATIGWSFEGDPTQFEIEYGVQGFTLGNGTHLGRSESFLSLSNLQPGTSYDVYVRCVCSSTLAGSWAMLTFQTDTLVPPVIPDPDTCSAVFNLHIINIDTTHATIGWSFEGNPDHFEAEYGVQGFALGSGTHVGVSESFLHLSDLQPDTYYDIHVRCGCGNDLWGEWAMITFHTDTLVPPVIPDDSTGIHSYTSNGIRIFPNPAHGQCVVHFTQEMPKVVRVYTIEGALVQEINPDKETMELRLLSSGVFILSCEMKEGTVLRKIVNR